LLLEEKRGGQLAVSHVNTENDHQSGSFQHAVPDPVSTVYGFIQFERFALCTEQFQTVIVKADPEQLIERRIAFCPTL